MKYFSVYFRINTESYRYNGYSMSFTSEEQRKQFYDYVATLFELNGWTAVDGKYSGECSTVTNGKQSLYLHPQSFSGVIAEDNIQCIKQLLSTAVGFSCYKTDIYEEIYDMTDEQYLEYLETKRDEITADILKIYTTKRRNLYVTTDVCFRIAQKYQLKRIQGNNHCFVSGNIECRFVESLFASLVEQKKILSADTKHGKGYRTATAKDVA